MLNLTGHVLAFLQDFLKVASLSAIGLIYWREAGEGGAYHQWEGFLALFRLTRLSITFFGAQATLWAPCSGTTSKGSTRAPFLATGTGLGNNLLVPAFLPRSSHLIIFTCILRNINIKLLLNSCYSSLRYSKENRGR